MPVSDTYSSIPLFNSEMCSNIHGFYNLLNNCLLYIIHFRHYHRCQKTEGKTASSSIGDYILKRGETQKLKKKITHKDFKRWLICQEQLINVLAQT